MRRLILVAAGVLSASSLFAVPAAHAATPKCFGKTATIVGSTGRDEIIGTDGTDVIVSGGGNDMIRSYNWNNVNTAAHQPDFICTGAGNDDIIASFASDHIDAGGGVDFVGAWGGSDVIQGGGGDDYIDPDSPGGGCIDPQEAGCVQQNDQDIVHGGAGADHLYSAVGPDKLYGDGGNDLIEDRDCYQSDSLFGGGGSDDLQSYRTWRQNTTGTGPTFDPCSVLNGRVSDYLDGGTQIDSATTDGIDTLISIENRLNG